MNTVSNLTRHPDDGGSKHFRKVCQFYTRLHGTTSQKCSVPEILTVFILWSFVGSTEEITSAFWSLLRHNAAWRPDQRVRARVAPILIGLVALPGESTGGGSTSADRPLVGGGHLSTVTLDMSGLTSHSLAPQLTLQSAVITICITCSNNLQPCIFPTDCSFVSCDYQNKQRLFP
jgi:hypothetical protein